MVLSDLCIRRPVFTIVINLLVVLLGFMAYQRLSLREYPHIDEPVVTVETMYPGASAEIIESQITTPLEEALAGVEGVDVMTSTSRPEFSLISLRFKLTRNPESAANDVRDRVSRSRSVLPKGIEEPVIAKVEADAEPIVYLAFSADKHSSLEITDYTDRYIKNKLQNISGVAEVKILSGRYAMRIWLDRLKLAAFNLTTADVEAALHQQNVEIPAGRIESLEREFTVLSESDLQTSDQFENLILKNVNGYTVKLKDVGRAELGAEQTREIARYNGASAVALGIVKQATANPLEISAGVKKVLEEIKDSLPQDMKVEIAYDTSIFIKKSIHAVFKTIAEAIILVIFVIFLFLRDIRSVFIPIVTIPVSLIGSFALIYACGFSINTLTLLAMVLAIGLVVDDAIVMLENIHRYIAKGLSPLEAAFKGSREIGFAIIAMTLTLAAVYIPIGFMEGRVGKLFTEFALTLAGAVLVSGFVALTLSPMMSAKLLKYHQGHGKFYQVIEVALNNLTSAYRITLSWLLKKAHIVLLSAGVTAIACVGFFFVLDSELAPIEDRGTIIAIGLAPEGSTIQHTDKWAKQVEGIFKTLPEAERFFVLSGFPVATQIIGFIGLKPWEDRKAKQQEIVNGLTPRLFSIPGILAFAINPPSLGQSPIERPIGFILKTSESYQELEHLTKQILAKIPQDSGFMQIDTDLKLNQPQLKVQIDREKTADLKLDISVIGRTLETLLGGRKATRFKREGKQYDVMVQMEDKERQNPSNISSIFVRSLTNTMIPLESVMKIEETVAPKELNHFNQQRSVTISAGLAPGLSLGSALNSLEQAAKSLPSGKFEIDYAGESREYKESGASLYLTFILALMFIYLVLAAQFESFKDPLIIMITVPLSIAGALLSLWLTRNTLNIYSQIGLITLVGLITKHGILIVEFANQKREEGLTVIEAVIEASTLRLRPILMTTAAMVLGSIPLALATEAGAESRQAIGWVIVGGLCLGTLLTLFVIPTVYVLLARRKADSPNHTNAAWMKS